MIVLTEAAGPEASTQAVAIFGAGLIGGSVREALVGQGCTESQEFPVSWTERASRLEQLQAVGRRLEQLPVGMGIDVIWSAGRAGFAANGEETRNELEAFTDVAEWLRGFSLERTGRGLSFHVVSSAGGLFEGQRFVDNASVPLTLRPYGELKLQQEAIARSLSDALSLRIYRPSTVYGVSSRKGRAGLINTLITNTKTHTVSRIFGGLDTIRDYVLASDVGKFIAAQTGRPAGDAATFLLASGKPTSVREVLSLVQRIVGRRLLVNLDSIPSNAHHITFRPSALPTDWYSTDLETGIRRVASQLSSTYEAAAGW